jgi:hypothetical protein
MADTQLTVVIALKDMLSGPMKALSGTMKALQGVFSDLSRYANIALLAIKGALILLGKEAVETAMHITRLSRITGIGTQELQRMGAAAIATGANFDRLSTGMKLLAEKAEKAAEGNSGFIDLFNKLDMSVRDGAGHLKNASDLFYEFADRIAAAPTSTEKMALAVEVLGRSGEELLPMLQMGSKWLKEFGKAAEDSGMVLSQKATQDLDIFGKQLQALKTIAVNMMGEWLAQTGVTVPKIINFFVDAAEIISKVFAGFKIIFMGIVEYGKMMASNIVLIYDALKNQLTKKLHEILESVEPFIINMASMLETLGKKDWADNLTQGFVKLKAATSDFNSGAIKELPGQLADAWEKTSNIVANKSKLIAEDTDANIKTLKEKASKVQDFMQKVDEVNRQTSASSGKAIEDMNAKIHTFSGGFEEAVKKFISLSGDWKEAWLGAFQSLEAGISGVMTKFITEGGKMRDFLKELYKAVEVSFVQMITKMMVQWALAQALGLFGVGGTGGSNSSPTNVGANGSNGGNAALGIGSLVGGAMGGSLGMGQLFGGGSSITPLGQTQTGGSGGGTFLGLAGGNSAYLGASIAGLGFGTATAYEGVQHGNVTHGVVGGLVGGAALGTMVMPGIGTVVGAVVGAIAGGFMANSAKRKQKKQEREAEEAQREAEQAMRAQARVLLAADIRAKYGGGLADISAVTDIGKVLSGGITDETLDQLGAQNIVNQAQEIGIGAGNVNVGAPNIVVNATVAGSYDVQRLAQDLGLHLASAIRVAASGASI